jgi:hypothetical protein
VHVSREEVGLPFQTQEGVKKYINKQCKKHMLAKEQGLLRGSAPSTEPEVRTLPKLHKQV